jgi:SAM-dependent methyltransferase
MNLPSLFTVPIQVNGNYLVLDQSPSEKNQQQTNEAFSAKWKKVEEKDDLAQMESFQKEWYLKLYGFETENELSAFLQIQPVIVDAGTGLGFKAAWFAQLAPSSLVLAFDLSDALESAAKKYNPIPNLFFVKADIGNTFLKPGIVNYISCDQVLHHTEDPERTFAHLSSLLKPGGQFSCYVYAKKALPRELVDDHFRNAVHQLTEQQLWELSSQLTELGKNLSELNVTIAAPDIPLLGIKGGTYDIQRFIYWNFLKCFWKKEWGKELSDSTNFDWYSPGNARRFTRDEFDHLASENHLQTLYKYSEEACHTGRFKK